MEVFVSLLFIVGAGAFCVWSVLGLIGAIKARKAKKAEAEAKESAVEDKDSHHEG